MDQWQTFLILCPAAVIGGAINSVAGGGTLVTFPALLWALGNAPGAAIIANATNTVALCPGAFSGAWGYRHELRELWKWVRWLAIPSLLGGALGSLIVIVAPESSFKAMVPWLIGLATLLFIVQPRLKLRVVSDDADTRRSQNWYLATGFLQFLIGLYGGYFGAGIGIMMLSSLSLLNIGHIHHINGLKTLLAGMINGVSVVVFACQQKVDWSLAFPMILAALLGGWLGAIWARKLERQLVRHLVITIGTVLTTWYFAQSLFSFRSETRDNAGQTLPNVTDGKY